jgi:hypothetical protein
MIINVWAVDGGPKCCAADFRRVRYPYDGVERTPCEYYAVAGLSWIGASGDRHDGPRCARHLMLDLGPMIPSEAK